MVSVFHSEAVQSCKRAGAESALQHVAGSQGQGSLPARPEQLRVRVHQQLDYGHVSTVDAFLQQLCLGWLQLPPYVQLLPFNAPARPKQHRTTNSQVR